MSAEVVTLGCRLNLAEGEAIRAGLAGEDELVVVNSCAVTAEAVVASRRAIRKAARARPEARIVVTGCASEIEPEAFATMPEVAAVVPNAAKLEAGLYSSCTCRGGAEGGCEARPNLRSRVQDRRSSAGPSPSLARKGVHARRFLPVQNGCDHRCTFCIIPHGRGPSRSVPAEEVIAAAREALARGQREVVLTGVDLMAYGADLPGRPGLGTLVERLLAELPALARLRLSSLDPCEIDGRLFDLIAHEPRVMPHVHLSLQAGHDLILKRMKRRHSRADAVTLVRRLKAARPGVAIGADLIAGFPTESEAMFAATLALLEDCDIAMGHIFPYSPRDGTPAARMPQLEREVVRARAARLRAAAEARQRAWLAGHVGTVQRVLIELDGASGHAEDFAKVRLQPALRSGLTRSTAGEIVQLRITAVDGDTLLGMAA